MFCLWASQICTSCFLAPQQFFFERGDLGASFDGFTNPLRPLKKFLEAFKVEKQNFFWLFFPLLFLKKAWFAVKTKKKHEKNFFFFHKSAHSTFSSCNYFFSKEETSVYLLVVIGPLYDAQKFFSTSPNFENACHFGLLWPLLFPQDVPKLRKIHFFFNFASQICTSCFLKRQ